MTGAPTAETVLPNERSSISLSKNGRDSTSNDVNGECERAGGTTFAPVRENDRKHEDAVKVATVSENSKNSTTLSGFVESPKATISGFGERKYENRG